MEEQLSLIAAMLEIEKHFLKNRTGLIQKAHFQIYLASQDDLKKDAQMQASLFQLVPIQKEYQQGSTSLITKSKDVYIQFKVSKTT